MKLRSIDYDAEENIKNITVTMSLNEAVALANLAGKLNGYANQKLGLTGDDDSLYDCITNVMNMHYEDGYPELPNFKELTDLNEKI